MEGQQRAFMTTTVEVARSLRRELTPTEEVLWRALRASKRGYKVRRQQPMGPFIVDFFVPQARLVIEIDGSVHELQQQQEYDRERQEFLEQSGVSFLRFKDQHIENYLEYVVEKIDQVVRQKASCPSPLVGEG
ncbi:MAG: DUF559 domain-containing protein [Magnetococcales bacterium]|nr:DUF559 domain-containing protein [Magnetococcales bacterium]